MLDFIIKNYYVILVVCILLIFAIIGYIIDSLKNRNFQDNNTNDEYVPAEEIFIQKFEETEEENQENNNESVDVLLDNYNNTQQKNNSNDWVFFIWGSN